MYVIIVVFCYRMSLDIRPSAHARERASFRARSSFLTFLSRQPRRISSFACHASFLGSSNGLNKIPFRAQATVDHSLKTKGNEGQGHYGGLPSLSKQRLRRSLQSTGRNRSFSMKVICSHHRRLMRHTNHCLLCSTSQTVKVRRIRGRMHRRR